MNCCHGGLRECERETGSSLLLSAVHSLHLSQPPHAHPHNVVPFATNVVTMSAQLTSQPASSSESSSLPSAAETSQASQFASNKRGRKAGCVNWTTEKLDMLLEQVAGVLPRGHQEWEKVTRNYNLIADEASDQERIKNKFFSLAGTRKPTGKHTKPEQITRAVHISSLIDEKVFAGSVAGCGRSGCARAGDEWR